MSIEDAYDEEEVKNEFPGVERLNILSSRYGISPVHIYRTYNEQDGICGISGYPMSDEETDGWYSIDIAPKIIHRNVSETNFMLVCSIINIMRPGTMRWEQFRLFCESIAERDDDN